MGFGQGFINTTQKIGQGASRASNAQKNISEKPQKNKIPLAFSVPEIAPRTPSSNEELKKEFFDSIEDELLLFNKFHLVRMARDRAKSANQKSIDIAPEILGEVLLWGREKIDPLISASLLEWPSFAHDIQVTATQIIKIKDEEIGDDKVAKILHGNYTKTQDIRKEHHYEIQHNILSCEFTPRVEVQITYEALTTIGIPNIKVYLFKLKDLDTQETRYNSRVAQAGYDKGKVDYFDLLVAKYGQPVDEQITDEKGWAEFTEFCNKYTAKSKYLVVSAIPNPEAKIKELYEKYDSFQFALAEVHNQVWAKNKPLWEYVDFVEQRNRHMEAVVYGGIVHYFAAPILYPLNVITAAFKEIKELLSKIKIFDNLMRDYENVSSGNGDEKLKNDRERELLREFKTHITVDISIPEGSFTKLYKEAKYWLTRYLSDEAVTYFMLKSALLYIRMQHDSNFRVIMYKGLAKQAFNLVFGLVLGIIAKRAGIPTIVITTITIWRAIKEAQQTFKALGALAKIEEHIQDFDEYMEEFAKHFEDIEVTVNVVKLHGQRYVPNMRSEFNHEELLLVEDVRQPKSVNINQPNSVG